MTGQYVIGTRNVFHAETLRVKESIVQQDVATAFGTWRCGGLMVNDLQAQSVSLRNGENAIALTH